MKKNLFLFLLTAFVTASFSQSKENYLLIGTYTDGKSEGIYVYKFDSKTGHADSVSMIRTPNPSFLAVSPGQKFVYAVHEIAKGGNGGEIAAFRFNTQNGSLTFLDQQFSAGDHPCYVAVDKTGKWVVAGNYSSGSLAVLPVQADGSLGKASTIIQHQGSGINKERQDKPHVHCTFFSKDNKYLFVPDLGIDKVMIYAFDEKTGKLTAANQPFAKSEPGSGPRHFTFHPNNKFAYLVEELSGTVVAYQYFDGHLNQIQRISTASKADTGFMGSADIHISSDGKFLYASNRAESNTIAIFKIGKTGMLTLIGHQSTLGKSPRNFNFDPSENFLLVANENSDEIVIFKRDKKTALLTDTGNRIKVGNPVCIKWIN